MGHYGEKDVTSKDLVNGDIVGLKFQVTDARKPILAVRRLVEKGSAVQLGPEPEQKHVARVEAGRKIVMEKKGGSFGVKASFVKKVEEDKSGCARQDW